MSVFGNLYIYSTYTYLKWLYQSWFIELCLFVFVFMFLIHEKPGVVNLVSLLLKMLVFPPNNSGISKVFFKGDPGSDGTSLNQVCHQVCWSRCFENWRESYGPICRWHRMPKGNVVRLYVDLLVDLAWGVVFGPEGYDENKSIGRHVVHLHAVFCLTTGAWFLPLTAVHMFIFTPGKIAGLNLSYLFVYFQKLCLCNPRSPPWRKGGKNVLHANGVMLHPGSGDIYITS